MQTKKDFDINADGSERVEYNAPDVPVRARNGMLSDMANYAARCHWHRDFEALSVVDGEMDYFVNGDTVHLTKGQAIFVNANRLHYGFSATKEECAYHFVVFHPTLLGDLPPIAEALNRLMADDSPDFLTLSADTGVDALIGEAWQRADRGQTLGLLSTCAALMQIVIESMGARIGAGAFDESWLLLRRMTGYIQDHYQETIHLDDVAAAAAVCRNTCCKLFREKLGCTPGEYITNYRLNKACAMMAQGSSEIGRASCRERV